MLNFVYAKCFTCTETLLCSQANTVIWKRKCSGAFQGSKPKALPGAVCDLSFKTVHFGCTSSANFYISEVFRVLGGYAEVSVWNQVLFQLQCTVNLMWTPENMCGAHARKKYTSRSTANTVHLEFNKSAYFFGRGFVSDSGLSAWSLHLVPVPVWGPFRYSGVLPWSRNMQGR